jgi:hypothetical protein
LLPAGLVDVSLRWHYDLELMENRKERWKELIIHGKMHSYWMTQQILTSRSLLRMTVPTVF